MEEGSVPVLLKLRPRGSVVNSVYILSQFACFFLLEWASLGFRGLILLYDNARLYLVFEYCSLVVRLYSL